MRPIYALAILLILNGCSFDNKSGIWKSENITDKSSDLFSEFETLSNENDNFDKVINFKIILLYLYLKKLIIKNG